MRRSVFFLLLGFGSLLGSGCKGIFNPSYPSTPLIPTVVINFPTQTPAHTSTSVVPGSPTPSSTATPTSTSTFTAVPINTVQTPSPTQTPTPTTDPSPIFSPTSVPTGAFHYKTEWGGLAVPPYSTMAGLAMDASGNIYCGNGNSVLEFDGNGNLLAQFGSMGTGNGQFYGAFGVAVDGSGNIYVSDFYQARVQKFNGSHNYLSQWSTGANSSDPWGLAADASGTVYVLSSGYTTGDGMVQKYLSNGTPVTQWGGPSQFQHAYSVALDPSGNFLYVGDDYRVQKFTTSGTLVTQWGGQGTGNGQFQGAPRALATDASGNVYVADETRMEVFDANGQYLFQFGTSGPGLTGPVFNYVTYGLTVNPATGDVYAINGFWPGGYIEKWGY